MSFDMPQLFVDPYRQLETDDRRWRRRWSDLVLRFVGRSVLDIETGDAENANFVSTEGSWCGISTDSTAPDCALARQRRHELRGDLVVEIGDIHSTNRSADTVLHVNTFDNSDDPQQQLRDAMAMVLPRGHLIILTRRFVHARLEAGGKRVFRRKLTDNDGHRVLLAVWQKS